VNSTGRVAKRTLAALAVVGGALLATGCSSADPGYPAIHDMPAARTETTLTPAEVKAATDSLVNEREHLNTETQPGTAQPVAATNAPAATGSVPQKKSAAAAQQQASGVNAYAKQ
jgi:hypothetical protein